MNIPVLIEPIPGHGYRAKGGEPFAVVCEGATPDEAVAKLKDTVQRQLDAGARVVSMQVGSSNHTWLPFAGMFQEGDPIVQQWLEILQSQRNEPGAA